MLVKISGEKDLIEFARQAWHILNNVRASDKDWHKEGGKKTRNAMLVWKQKADDFIKSMAPINGHDLSKTDIIKEESK